jgi:hypothetical protein
MPTIRVDEEVFTALQSQAQPFVDTPNDVLRRLLRLNPSQPAPRQAPVDATPERAYRTLILESLAKADGSAPGREVLRSIEQAMDGAFKASDLEPVSSGAIRWKVFANFERKNMVMKGLLKPDSPRGIWELTEKGCQEAKQQS